MKKIIVSAFVLSLLSSTAIAASAAPSAKDSSPFQAGDWLIRARALTVAPDVGSTVTPIGGNAKINTTEVPEVDFTYFFTGNISAELIAAVTPHNLRMSGGAADGTDVGRAWLLPPTLTLQYHVTQLCPYVIPYVGAGLNYTHFFNTDAGALSSVKYSDSVGGALQAGLDVPLGNNWYANLDVKKVYINTTAKFNGDTIHAKVNIDPWLVGVGIGYKF